MKLRWKLFRSRSLDAIIDVADEYVFHGDLEKVIEVTYSYRDIDNENILNETLFEEYTGLQYPEYDVQHLGRVCRYKLQLIVLVIEKIIKKGKKLNVHSRKKIHTRNNKIRKKIFIDSLKHVRLVLENAIEGIDFELEKAGIPYKKTEKQISKKISEIETREKIIFGPKVIEVPYEFSSCYNFILKNHLSKQNMLSDVDKKAMESYLKKIKSGVKFELDTTGAIKQKRISGKFLKQEIIRKDYRKIFDLVCELYGLPQRTKITNAASIYDGDDFLEIPKNPEHAVFTLDRLLKLLTHEIESHYINSYNGRILLGKFRGSKNLPKEEGLAMFMEKIFQGYNYDDIHSIVEYFFTTMAGEVLAGDDFLDFMRIMGKEYKCKRNHINSVRRAKRNYSFDYKGVQHKDVVYFRGLMELLQELKKGHQFSRLFLGKVGFHDVNNLYKIYFSHPRKEEIIYPIFISDLIYYYFTHKSGNKNFIFSTPDYYLYLKKKYWFIDIESFSIIPCVQRDWKKIEKILNILEGIILENR
ncbi:DUF1704 domain-containing protein [Candidatus Gracilibacteria bacterium]|nr:DUF1704 domain-containing protein [Candidatus Gracilibacteria bacterium]